MPPPRMQPHDLQSVGDDQLSTAYSLLLLSEYNHTLDSLPLDLSRNFADLRELDAVLSSSMQTMTTKITNLTTMIEEGKATTTPSERLWLLHELAEEAGRLKLGGEDKIRVACQAGDNLKAHNNHLRNLTDTLPGFDTSVLIRKTQYPHVSAQSFMPVHTTEHGRRRRNVAGSLLTAQSNPADPSPAKRKRVVNREDDIDVGSIKSPRKERVETNGRGRGNARLKKVTERAPSPAESDVLSVNYRQPSQNARSTAANSRAANASGSTNKRARGNANSNRNGTPLSHADYANTNYDARFPPALVQQNGATSSSGRRDAYAAASSSLAAYTNGAAAGMVNGVGNHQQIIQAYDMHNLHLQNWNPTTGQPLEGPGMPVSRNTNHVSAAAAAAAASAAAMAVDNGGTDGDGDADDARYCFCNGVSYGEMIGCDGESCEREWFHLACIGLDAPPSGNWFCDDCKNKRNQKRTARGGKRRAGGGRGSGKNA
ncbi:hypothetical protein EST38_g2790 [Candolleomyces aberdarensis]|uniref:Chromatin modification-related protein n=1 Tax=Candolleomyces aberdarensis TaxID=2316362 RepID=A0A4Q2DS34_9AGAR|nr:hypothetical protein EST38_g2790 [Candolleomyces aberdarensis]